MDDSHSEYPPAYTDWTYRVPAGLDKEMAAIVVIELAMKDLDKNAKIRVLDYASKRVAYKVG